jgi:hypothetical protein
MVIVDKVVDKVIGVFFGVFSTCFKYLDALNTIYGWSILIASMPN